MASLNVLIGVCLVYVAVLFAVAFGAERVALRGRAQWLRSSVVYTLSLSIYCTAWTFYGAVGYAARSGLEYLTIYIGPSLVMVGWLWVVRKLVRIGRSQRITSIADLISSRYGKSNLLAVLVTVLAVIGTTPYIALQLQSVTLSFGAFAAADPGAHLPGDSAATALWVAAGLAFFTVLFGTRNLDANERHHGVVMAIAVEAVVKLVALLAVGAFVVWGVGGGLGQTLARIDASALGRWDMAAGRWSGLIFLSAAAFLCLPRMFQVLVVENEDERHLRTASWAFPAYVMLMSLFVVPIAVTGLAVLPAGANPDLFVLTVPLAQGRDNLAMLSFLGGFSSATSMVIVASIALSTMVSNHVVMPIWLKATGGGAMMAGDVRHVVLLARRVSIVGVVLLGYFYYRVSGGGTALAAIGLISFSGVTQVLPALLGGIFWRGATRAGAAAGLLTGFALWVWCLFLPSFGAGTILPATVFDAGPFGIGWLRPQALFGIEGLDPLVHGVLWSMLFNTGVFCLISVFTFPSPLERLQGAQFVNVFDHSGTPRGWRGGVAQSEDLMIMAQRILGAAETQTLFREEAGRQGLPGFLPEPSADFLQRLERKLSGSVGAATAHAMVGQIVGGTGVSVEDLMAVADETAQIMEYSNRLEVQSAELERTARQLRAANEKLTQLSVQKDGFLGQISHELRTPMTSIRAFSEILRDTATLTEAERARYSSIIHDEAVRLTRLLDDLLDLAVLENGEVSLNLRRFPLWEVLDRAEAAAGQRAAGPHSVGPHGAGPSGPGFGGPGFGVRGVGGSEPGGAEQSDANAGEAGPAFDGQEETGSNAGGQGGTNPGGSDGASESRARAGRGRLRIRRDRRREQITLTTDQDRLAQVFINLISNADKYCDAAAPRLDIVVGARDGRITVDLIDNGSGIETDMQSLIFEKFSRIGEHKAGGAGLGLAICREIMRRLGGEVGYLPGQGGAAFRVTLPATAPEPAARVPDARGDRSRT